MSQNEKVKTRRNDKPSADAVSLLSAQALRLVSNQLEQGQVWQAERSRLIEERTWLRTMIDQVPDYLFVKDRENRFVIANRAVACDLGRTPDSIIGLTDADLHQPDRSREFMADETRVMQTGEPMIDKEEFILLASGQQRWLSTSKVPLRDAGGEIVGLVGVARDITQRKQAEEQVRYLAYNDPLTRLPNRASFEASFAHAAESLESGEEARLMLVDLDRFKQVNDTMGHAAGDELLCQVASRLTQLCGRSGQVARIGGDEFAIITRFSSSGAERSFCDTLVSELRSFSLMGNRVHVGASVGIANIHYLTTAFSALREADIALYECKAAGRNGWRAFEHRMADLVETRLRVESDLHAALITGEEFFVLYQPIFDMTGTTRLGVEALVRWQHPELGILTPDRFIPLAEDLGCIVELGELVLRRACQLLSRTDLSWIAVNVSPAQLRHKAFVQRLFQIASEEGVDVRRLELEISEGVALEQTGATRGVLEELRALGIRIAIDEFCSGYSSLNYLGQMRVDKIKIDQSFVAAIGSTNADAIVRAVIAFAKALQVTVTAEGVETESQRQFLEHAGCDQLQGYLVARPMREAALRLEKY